MRLLLVLGASAPVIRHIAIYGLGWLTPNYSATRDFISELSAFGAPYFWSMTVVGIGLIGVMMVSASFALYRYLPRVAGDRVAVWLLGISGVAFICIALFPCDPACEVRELNPRMVAHLIAGLTATGAEVSSAFVFGLMGVVRGRFNSIRAIALVLGVVGLAAYLLLLPGVTDLPPGLLQRIVQGTGDLWLFVASVSCLLRSYRGNP